MNLSEKKLKRLMPVIEKVNETFRAGTEVRFLVPSDRPLTLFKDLWQLRSAFKWSGKLRFTKQNNGVEIHIYGTSVLILDVEAQPKIKPEEITQENLKIRTLSELAMLVAGHKEKTLLLSLSHLTISEREKLDRVIKHHNFTSHEVNHITTLTRVTNV